MKTIRSNAIYMGDLCTGATGPVGDVYTATIGDGDQVVEVTDDTVAVLVGDFVYFIPDGVNERNAPTWLHCTAAEFTKWMRA